MTGLTTAGCAVVYTAETPPRLLWTKRSDSLSLGGFHTFPGGVVDAVDASLPTDDRAPATVVCALRELFEEVGVLIAEGAEALTRSTRSELRALFRRDPRQGAELFHALNLRFRTSQAEAVGRWVTPEVGVDVPRFDTYFHAWEVPTPAELIPDEAEVAEAEWVDPQRALARWERGAVLIPPPVATILRSATPRFDGAAMRAGRHADGTPAASYEIVPGIVMLPLRTPTLPPATHTNCYLVGGSDAVLVEPASPYEEEIQRAVEFVTERRSAGVTVHAILATHHHPDHVGGAVALKERLGLPLWAHPQTIGRLEGSVTFERAIEDGERLVFGETVLEAVHTPGHAPGHLCFVEARSGAMLAGDMVAGIGTILVEPTDGDMALYIESLREIARREPSMLLPAHGGPIIDSVGKAESYIAHRLMRQERVLSALTDYGRPALPTDIVPTAYDDASPLVYPIAALATEAHLIKLAADGRVSRQAGRWTVV